MLFKGWYYKDNGIEHRDMIIGVATASSFDGEYTIIGDEPLLSMERFSEVEDPHMWTDKKDII